MNMVGCPVDPDETVEAYLLGRLSEEQNSAFEDHFLSCPRCSERLQFTQDFIVGAVFRLVGDNPTHSIFGGGHKLRPFTANTLIN